MIDNIARDLFIKSGALLPIDLNRVAEICGIRVLSSSNSQEAGSAYIKDGEKVVEVLATDPPTRQRFTLAHEIGHHVLGHTRNGTHFRENSHLIGSCPREIDANRFAAELLVPAQLLEQEFLNSRSLSSMASLFGVSEQVIFYRLKDLGYMHG